MKKRADKWERVSGGTMIPAGQPYRVERSAPNPERATEYERTIEVAVPVGIAEWFVDSTWKPPLELPTDPTWGVALGGDRYISDVRLWSQSEDGLHFHTRDSHGVGRTLGARSLTDFIPLTPEQVARIEAHA